MSWEAPEILSMQAIGCDRWDRREHQRATKGVRTYSRARNRLGKVARTGPDALVDVFMLLVKANPKLLAVNEVQPGHQVNRLVAFEMLSLTATRRLRAHTVGDTGAAVLGCISLAPTLEALFERLELERQLAEEIEAKVLELGALRAALTDQESRFDAGMGAEPTPEDIEQALAAADELRAARSAVADAEIEIDTQMQELMDRLASEASAIREALRDPLGRMAGEASELEATARAWGLEAGALHRLSAEERLKLARQLGQQRMREIADLFGRMRTVALCDAHEALDGTHEEIVDLELGSDLGRTLASELLFLGDPDTERDLLARLADGGVLQYSVRGSDELGRGGIVMCIDCSGSMGGQPELWTKAVMLNLLHQAREQRREMHVIHFSGPGQTKHFGFEHPADFTATRIMDAAGTFFGGGTDFQTPMSEALRILVDEHARTGATRADVVFATDDECAVRKEFMENYLTEMRRIGARTYGLDMRGYGVDAAGALATMCEGRVASVTDLRSGKDLRPILRAVAAG